MDLLVLCAEAPTAAHPRPHGLIAALARRGHSVTLLFADEAGTTFDDLAEHCRQMLPVRRRRLAAAARAEAANGAYDLAHVDGPAAGLLGDRPGLPCVLDLATCGSLRRARAVGFLGPIARLTHLVTLPARRRAEAALVARFSRVIVATNEDAAALRRLGKGGDERSNIHVVPSTIDTERFAPPTSLRDPATLLLDLRELSRAEARAALGAVSSTMPLIWAQRADIRLTVLGPLPLGAAGPLSGDPRVVFTGPVHDPRGHLGSATLALAPFGPAASAPHAALEALATGTALVAGTALARDLAAAPGLELATADTPRQIAATALALLDNPPYRGQLGRAGRRLVERHHSWERAVASLEEVYGAATGAPLAEWRLEVGMDRPRPSE